MNKLRAWKIALTRSRWLPAGVILVTLGILGLTIALARERLRQAVGDQIVGRDGEVLFQVIHLLAAAPEGGEWENSLEDPGEQLDLILRASRMRGVLGVRLYDPQGRFQHGLPADIVEAGLDPEILAAARELRPVSRFYPRRDLSELFYFPPDESGSGPPILEVNVPLHGPTAASLTGVAQFIIAGEGMAAELARLDRVLAWQALAAFLAAGGLLVLALAWAFRRLAERTAHLQRANEALALTARTSALGAVTAHLIHGLKNPLAGLQSFVASRPADNGDAHPEWAEAAASTRRMQALINEVVAVLREEQGGQHYELTVAELLELVEQRIGPAAREKGVIYQARANLAASLSNRVANLLLLVLANLLQNAVQATAPAKRVTLEVKEENGQLVFLVADEGPGLPPGVAANLFQPCVSTKEGGSGLGLAISKQLATHLGAALELTASSPQGCVFALRIDRQNLFAATQ